MNTHFASPERSSHHTIKSDHTFISSFQHVQEILDGLPYISVLLNHHRQIVYSNKAFKNFLGSETMEEILGMRPGDAINCIHAHKEINGCGTSKNCRYCGATNTIIRSQNSGKIETAEFSLHRNNNGHISALEMLISASPFAIQNKSFILITFNDVSAHKRWQLLEKIFFHDIMNKLGGLHGFLELQNIHKNEPLKSDYTSLMLQISDEVIEEIQAQHKMILAENRELSINIQPVSIPSIIDTSIKQMLKHFVASNKEIEFVNNENDFFVDTDPVLLKRVLINLIKNALEASSESNKVTLGCKNLGYYTEIWVQNSEIMPENVQLQLFQRTFSTKGTNRGLGTYSIKLLTEEYLMGKVTFESSENTGTIFRLFINLKYPEKVKPKLSDRKPIG